MGNECCRDSNISHQEQSRPLPSKLSPRGQQSKKKDYSGFKSYGKIKEQNQQMIAGKKARIEKYDREIASATERLEEKVREQSETRKDLSYQIKKIESEIESLKRLKQVEEKAIKNLEQM